jgi:hypothetical protein
LAAYKYPHQIQFSDELPKTPSGKFSEEKLNRWMFVPGLSVPFARREKQSSRKKVLNPLKSLVGPAGFEDVVKPLN